MPQIYNLYDQEEIDMINKIKEENEKTEEFFANCRQKWNDDLKPMFETTLTQLTIEYAQKIMERQLTALAYSQNMNEEISFYLTKRSKKEVRLKKSKQDKIVWYAIGSPLAQKKLSASQMSDVIDAHVAELQRGIELIESHIEFLRTAMKRLDNLGFTIKHIIDFYNILGKNSTSY